ncbi:hypothetical protein [Clostridium sp. AM58-1XD]|uniref:hypothetical protein n=1 Tax=Clostridium sp. AM58-1XD TaxID=2292307 RepID=UPI000E491F9F|nr:hypothetical protein [Clostridium sp. AM58-1XD]RGZ01499.1 hypothetical protein DXA13_01235 [Clostridium sp. AM58-1XD]
MYEYISRDERPESPVIPASNAVMLSMMNRRESESNSEFSVIQRFTLTQNEHGCIIVDFNREDFSGYMPYPNDDSAMSHNHSSSCLLYIDGVKKRIQGIHISRVLEAFNNFIGCINCFPDAGQQAAAVLPPVYRGIWEDGEMSTENKVREMIGRTLNYINSLPFTYVPHGNNSDGAGEGAAKARLDSRLSKDAGRTELAEAMYRLFDTQAFYGIPLSEEQIRKYLHHHDMALRFAYPEQLLNSDFTGAIQTAKEAIYRVLTGAPYTSQLLVGKPLNKGWQGKSYKLIRNKYGWIPRGVLIAIAKGMVQTYGLNSPRREVIRHTAKLYLWFDRYYEFLQQYLISGPQLVLPPQPVPAALPPANPSLNVMAPQPAADVQESAYNPVDIKQDEDIWNLMMQNTGFKVEDL